VFPRFSNRVNRIFPRDERVADGLGDPERWSLITVSRSWHEHTGRFDRTMWIDQRGSEVLTTPECHRLLAVAAKKGPPARRETAGVSALYKCSRQGICIPNIAVGADLAPSNPVHLDLRRAPRK
jgi:hypothetical protein